MDTVVHDACQEGSVTLYKAYGDPEGVSASLHQIKWLIWMVSGFRS